MKHAKWIRFLALFLLLAMVVGAIPAVLAANDSADLSAEESSMQEEQTVPEEQADVSYTPAQPEESEDLEPAEAMTEG